MLRATPPTPYSNAAWGPPWLPMDVPSVMSMPFENRNGTFLVASMTIHCANRRSPASRGSLGIKKVNFAPPVLSVVVGKRMS